MPKSTDELRVRALAEMQAARSNLGDEAIAKISSSIQEMEQKNVAIEAARSLIESEMDAERAMIEILGLLEEGK